MQNFDIRDNSFTFKHGKEESPNAYQENYREHYHTSYELFYFLQGDCDFIVQQDSYTLKPHDLIIVKPGEHHNIIIHSQTAYDRMVIRFSGSSLPGGLEHEVEKLATCFNLKDSHLSEEFKRMGFFYNIISDNFLIPAFTSQLIIILSCLCSSINLQKKADSTNHELEKILSYIDQNASSIMCIEDICKFTNKSQSSIQKLFYEQFQTSVMAYVRTKKCMNAHHLLSQGHPAKNVYEECGFETYSTFYRCYVKTYGRSPSTAK